MRNIILEREMRRAHTQAGVAHLVAVGRAFGLANVHVTLRAGAWVREIECTVDEMHQFFAVFESDVTAGTAATLIAADPSDREGCYSSCETVVP